MWGENAPAWITWRDREWPVRVVDGRVLSLVPLSESGEEARARITEATCRDPEQYSYAVEDLPSLRYVEDDAGLQVFWAAVYELQVERAGRLTVPDVALSLLPPGPVVERQGRRGPVLAYCGDCGHPIWDPEYATRPGGPKGRQCGGRIGHPREQVPGMARRPAGGDGEDQMELFVVVKVQVRA